ncbi:MAG: Zn-ribbon-containing, possibly RNA-binding protein and truncated derivatives [uncultured Nocardioidaceae bacterium]|uniref:Zn-ribbon-containing, possibly RNA-binding protein and truncated derivatives n=1 Tax=uncultured Nocardioidaceae bacterium TaxID=253824 RepID=A0A6J4LT70_9ACTN|nr:MAG: Zn-ribbon-containing, possibly RNA-binding protein and truncated derivatives [uncultured Nocardioidaceae bacterium]
MSDPRGGAGREPEHDETGLDLARAVARSLAGSVRGRRRSGRQGPDARRARLGSRLPRVDPQSSGAHPDDRDPQLLDATIGRLIAEQGWDTDVRVHAVFSRWDHLVGAEVAQHCLPASFTEGRLVVRTDSTAWATQMRLLAGTVLRRLNEELGEQTVTMIDVHGPSTPSWRKGRRSVRDGRGPRDTYG